MKVHVFKQINYKPVGISAIAENEFKIFIFRSDKTLEILDSITFRRKKIFNFNHVFLSAFCKSNYVYAISEEGNLLKFNYNTLDSSILQTGYTLTDFIFNNTFLLTTSNGFILEYDGCDIVIKFKCNTVINCLCNINNLYLLGLTDKLLILNDQFTIINEMSINEGIITKINQFEEQAVLITSKGSLVYFDILLQSIIQIVKVRDSPLTSLVCDTESVIVTGDDSRIICYKLNQDLFTKSYQVDVHYGRSTCMLWCNRRVIVGNTDGILSVLVPLESKFQYMRLYDRGVGVSSCRDKLLINNRFHLDLFQLGDNKDKKIVDISTDEFPVKLDESFFTDFCVTSLGYNCTLRINTQFCGICCLVSDFILWSENTITKVYNINTKETRTLCIFGCTLINATQKGVVLIYNNEIKYTVGLEDLMTITLEEKHEIKDDTLQLNMLHLNEILVDVCGDVILTQNKSYDLYKKYTIYKNKELIKEVCTFDIIIDVVVYKDEIWYSTQSYLYNVSSNKKYEMGAVLYKFLIHNGNLLVVKQDWIYIKEHIERGVFKKKYAIK